MQLGIHINYHKFLKKKISCNLYTFKYILKEDFISDLFFKSKNCKFETF